MNQRVDGQLLTRAEAAGALRVSMETLRRWTRNGELHALRLGTRAVRYRRRDVDGFIARAQKRA